MKNDASSAADRLSLRGLELAPAQVWGGVRLVPLLRRRSPGDLRLARRRYEDQAMVVSIDGELLEPGTKYVSYVPHGLVMSWNDDGTPVAAYGTHLHRSDGKQLRGLGASVRIAHRMARREQGRTLRFLPLHLAMEGYLAHHFGGPEIAWTEYSRRAKSSGLAPRSEYSFSGSAIVGLDDALRLFEIHEHQVGVLVFVADALASAFVVPHPEDYRALHRTLLEDFYGELIWQYALHAVEQPIETSIDDARISSLADLREALARMRSDWAEFHELSAAGILERGLDARRIYRAGPFSLERFMPSLDPSAENHIGERILREDGTLEYLKTYRLSASQTRRAFLLSALAAQSWNLDAAAARLGESKDQLMIRLEKAGFGYLVREDVLAAARKRARTRTDR